MKNEGKVLVAIIVVIGLLGFIASPEGHIVTMVADEITEGAYFATESAAEISNILKEARQETEKEHLAETVYPDDYDPTNPVSNGEFSEDDWDAIQQEEAMRSLAEDAMNNYYQEKPDISDEVIKP